MSLSFRSDSSYEGGLRLLTYGGMNVDDVDEEDDEDAESHMDDVSRYCRLLIDEDDEDEREEENAAVAATLNR